MDRRFFFRNSIHSLGLLLVAPASLLARPRNISNLIEHSVESFELNQPELIPVPDDPENWNKFREQLNAWRKEAKTKLNYSDALYRNPDFRWASSAYNCYFLMMYDETFYNRKEGKYLVEEFIDESEKAFGRLDIVVLWHAYPRIGLDDRNQFDFYREMPGGLSGLRKVADQFHRRNIKVYLNYNPWDTGTRRENDSDIDALTLMVRDIDADGIFLDTLNRGSNEFRNKLDGVKKGVVLESELALPVEDISSHHMSWAQWFQDSKAPGILRNKWFERRHIQHGISRWQRDRTRELQTAWMNGSGIMIWENVFGQWVGWNERDKSILRLMSPIQKRYIHLFSGEGWMPMAGESLNENVYANCWEAAGLRLWTLVNRSEQPIEGDLLKVIKNQGDRFYDLIQGKEITVFEKDEKSVVNGTIFPRGIGCFVTGEPSKMDGGFQSFLSSQAEIYKKMNWSTEFPEIQAKRLPSVRTRSHQSISGGMVKIPEFKGSLEVVFRVREVGFYDSVDPRFVNIGAPGLHYETTFSVEANLPEFQIDETPVTNFQYHQFLKETGYRPSEKLNFLKHWSIGRIPDGKEDHPVVYVSLEDARAYASWAGKRLPTELEWQFAGQGYKKNKFPWGNKMSAGFCNSGEAGELTAVKAYPKGKSAFGCFDMCGNAWEMTESEHSDGRNRFCILKGGSYYKAKGYEWYFDGGAQPLNFSAKQLLIYPGIDRCGTVGFRCAADI